MDRSLQFIYDREHARRAHRQAGQGSGDGLSIPLWINQVRHLFPRQALEVMERDALRRYGLHELVTDPEVLARVEPSEDILKAILQFKHLMKPDVLEQAREVVRKVVEGLAARLYTAVQPSLTGPKGRRDRPAQRTFRNTDWRRTVRANLKHYDLERQALVAAQIHFQARQRTRSPWRILIAVDQSGSMVDSLIHSAVMAAIFATVPSLDVRLLLWDHRLVDMSDQVEDPMEVLLASQLGGGTDLDQALQLCAEWVDEPERTLLVVVSDWFIWNDREACLRRAAAFVESGVRCVGLCALDADGRGSFDEGFARGLAETGWHVAAMTPEQLADYVGEVVQ